MPDIKPLKPIQEGYNLALSLQATHAKRFARTYLYDEVIIHDDDKLAALKDPEDGTLIGVPGGTLKDGADKIIAPVQNAPLDTSVYTFLEESKLSFREVGGATEAERGVVERRKTATEASDIAQKSDIRRSDRRSLVEDFASVVGQKVFQSMQANLAFQYTIPILSERKVQGWASINKENIAGDMTVGVEIGSTTPNLPEYQIQELTGFLQFVTQLPQEIIFAKVNFNGIVDVFKRAFNSIDLERILNSPEEEQQKMQQWAQMQQAKNPPQQGEQQGAPQQGAQGSPVRGVR